MCREAKAKLAVYLRARRGSGGLSRAHFDVAERLLFKFHNAESGLCFPSLDAIAEAARVSKSTVQRALAFLERIGVVSWVNRLEWAYRIVEGVGRQRVPARTSNGYQFHMPSEAAQGLPWAAKRRRPDGPLAATSGSADPSPFDLFCDRHLSASRRKAPEPT